LFDVILISKDSPKLIFDFSRVTSNVGCGTSFGFSKKFGGKTNNVSEKYAIKETAIAQ